MRLGSSVAVAVTQASSYSSDWTPSLGTSIGAALKRKRNYKKYLRTCLSLVNET